jgi:Raf kinase inhibitor-like YbhB/YbcL family protein
MNPAEQPASVQSFAVIFRDMENASPTRGPEDTLHWSIFNIPGTAKGLPEGVKAGEQPDGTKPGPGIRGGANGSYFGPGAGAGPFHHYMFEFFALDAKLDLPATATRAQLLAAMEGHVVGKAVYGGRFRRAQ